MANPKEPGFTKLTGYSVVTLWEINHQHPVWLLSHSKRREDFAVQYGEQRKERLDRLQAAREFGQCILHALQCNGAFD